MGRSKHGRSKHGRSTHGAQQVSGAASSAPTPAIYLDGLLAADFQPAGTASITGSGGMVNARSTDTISNDAADTTRALRAIHIQTKHGQETRQDVRSSLATVCLFGALLLALYVPVVAQTGRRWFMTEQYAHSIFIFPIVCGLLWVKRDAIRSAPRQPSAWGLLPLTLGLLTQAISHALKFEFVGMLSLLPTLAGGILLLHGPALWRIVRFPVLFLGFAANLPVPVLDASSHAVQSVSATGAARIMKSLGFVLAQQGNILHVPGMTLEVAEACSGFRKLSALMVFAVLYGYLYPISNLRRLGLVLLIFPIALLANIARLCALIVAATSGGAQWESGLHDPAEMAVLVVAFGLMVAAGRRLGCVRPRFAHASACS